MIDGVVITFTDVSAARALELAAKEQALQLRQMAESLPHLVWGARADGAFDFLSRQWTEYTGISDAEQLAWGWLDQVYPADRDRVREQWRAAVKSGVRFDSEFRIRSSSGDYRWFKTRAVAIRDTEGRITKWYGSSTDVDDLKDAGERLAMVLQSISDGFLSLDDQLRVVAANAAAEAVLGRPATQLVGKSLFDLVPEARAAEETLQRPPGEFALDLAHGQYHARVQRDLTGGSWLFLSPFRQQS